MAKEKKPLFTQMEFDNAQYAMDVKAKCEAKLVKVKLGLMIAAGAELAWIFALAFRTESDFVFILQAISFLIALVATVAAYIIGGGLGKAFVVVLGIAKAIGWFGWFCVPFPIDIFTGLLCTLLAVLGGIYSFFFIPLAVVFCNYIQINKDLKAAKEYLKYCVPVNTADGGGVGH